MERGRLATRDKMRRGDREHERTVRSLGTDIGEKGITVKPGKAVAAGRAGRVRQRQAGGAGREDEAECRELCHSVQ